jgi:TolB-like protein/tetratricopeptide (TPR) repeat protein
LHYPIRQCDIVLASLERLLTWEKIARSQQLGRFLDYVVRLALEGKAEEIRAYNIAVDVFGRSVNFDPQTDPIVRVQARRLRALLSEYNAGLGAGDSVQIELPVGHYVPKFTFRRHSETIVEPERPRVIRETKSPPSRTAQPKIYLFILAASLLTILGAFFVGASWPASRSTSHEVASFAAPKLFVTEFQNLTSGRRSGLRSTGVGLEVVTALRQFGDIEVIYAGNIHALGDETQAPQRDYTLGGVVRQTGTQLQFSAVLSNRGTGEVVWSRAWANDDKTETVEDFVRLLSIEIASPQGPVHSVARRALDTQLDNERVTYLCKLQFNRYRETWLVHDGVKAIDCYNGLTSAEQLDPRVLAATARLIQNLGTPALREHNLRLNEAKARIQRALEIDPLDSFVWLQSALVNWRAGFFDAAEVDFLSSLRLNPYNPDTHAAYAMLLVMRGDNDDAREHMEMALNHQGYVPDWYLGASAMLALGDGDYDKAVSSAEIYAKVDREFGPVLAVVAGAESGNRDVVNRYLPQVLEVGSFRGRGILTQLAERFDDPKLMASLRQSLLNVGIPSQALVSGF